MSGAATNNFFTPTIQDGFGIITGNPESHSIQRNNYLVSATSISMRSKTEMFNKSTGNQITTSTDGDLLFYSDLGNVEITGGYPGPEAINLIASNIDGGVTITSGDGGLTFDTTGPININSTGGGDIDIGGATTGNINISSEYQINMNTDEYNLVTSNNITMVSINGEIIMASSNIDGNQTVLIDNGGNLVVGSTINRFGYKSELSVSTSSNSSPGQNGLIIYSSNTDVSPELQTYYSNPDGSRAVKTTLGVYSSNSQAGVYKSYTAYQYGQVIIRLSGPEFTYNDVGRKLISRTTSNSSIITDLATVILPPIQNYGSGVVTLTAGGYYLGANDAIFIIEIDSEIDVGAGRNSDTFRWSMDGGATWVEQFVPVSYALTPIRYPLIDTTGNKTGVYITFSSDSINSKGDSWTIYAKITAIVDENRYPNTGSNIHTSTSGSVFTGVYTSNNQPIIITNADEGWPVFSNLSANLSLQQTDTLVSLAPFTGYVGTDTNNDLILKTGGVERMRVTADGSLCVGQEGGNARLQLSSNFNKVMLVNDNILNSTSLANSAGIIGVQQNPASTELNTGGYVISYESQNTVSGNLEVFGNYFTANGDKIGSTFNISGPSTYTQFAPHVAKSYDKQSDQFVAVWVRKMASDDSLFSIYYRGYKNGNEPIMAPTLLSTGVNISLAPRICAYDGGYIVTYTAVSDNNPASKYSVNFINITWNGNNFSTPNPPVAVTTDATKNYVYPFATTMSAFDPVVPGGFTISFLAQTITNDARYQIKYRVYAKDLTAASAIGSVTTTGVFNTQDDQDLALTDGLPSCIGLPDSLAKLYGGFAVAFNTNYSAATDYSTLITQGITISGLSSKAFGRLENYTQSVDNTITLTVSNVYLDFIQGEKLQLISPQGYIVEKAALVSSTGNTLVSHWSNITLSKDPKNIQLVCYSTESLLNNPTGTADELYRKIVNTSELTLDNARESLSTTAANVVPLKYTRTTDIPSFYASRTLTGIKNSSDSECLVCWQSGSVSHVYTQRISMSAGDLINGENLLAQTALGQSQTDPYISSLITTQGDTLGYSVSFGQPASDYSYTAISQQLVGSYSYLINIKNETAQFVVDNDGRLGLGTNQPSGTLHIASLPSLNPSTPATTSLVMQSPSVNIDTQNDKHQIRFTDGAGTDLARIKVKYSDYYQDLNPQANYLISYFKFDETPGTLSALNSSAFNIQKSEAPIDLTTGNINTGLINNQSQSGVLIGFDPENCWTTGKINNGLVFNGFNSSNYVKINRSLDFSAPYPQTIPTMGDGSFAVSAWVKLNGPTFDNTTMGVLSIGTDELDGDINLCGNFQLYLENGAGSNIYPVIDLLQTTTGITSVAPVNVGINDGEWHHVVWDFLDAGASSLANIWIDNTCVVSTSIPNGINKLPAQTSSAMKDVYIGSDIGGTGLYLNATLDEMRFYKTHLSSADISRLYMYGAEQRASLIIQTLGTNSQFVDTAAGLVLDDTGSLLGAQFRNNTSRILTGALYFQNIGQTTVFGTDTQFLTEINVGDNLLLADDIALADITDNLYQVVSIIDDESLVIDRPVPSVTSSNVFFDNVTSYPGIFSARDENNDLKMSMNSFGDLIIGSRRSTTNPTRVEIRGSGEDENKNGLTLHNTATTSISTPGSRPNKLYFKTSNSTSQADVLTGLVKTSLTGNGAYSSQMDFYVNRNTTSDVLADSGLFRILSLTDNSVLIGESAVQSGIETGQIIVQTSDDLSLGCTFVNRQIPDDTVFSCNTDFRFYNETCAAGQNNELVRVMASHDYPESLTGSKACGRLDFYTSDDRITQPVSFTDGKNLADPQQMSRLCVTSGGYVGVHNQRPHGVFQVSPRYIDNDYKVFSANISATAAGSLTITDNIVNGIDGYLLRGGALVVSDGNFLTEYPLSNIANPINWINPTTSIDLADTTLTLSGVDYQPYSLHYPGLVVNKYGLVGIGNAAFGDDDTNYHLDVSGNVAVKGVLSLTSDLSQSADPSTSAGLRVSSGQLEIQDSATNNSFVSLTDFVQKNANPIRVTILNDITLQDHTVLVNGPSGNTIALPALSNPGDNGKILVIKNINASALTVTAASTIDGAPSANLIQNQVITVQVYNGAYWVIGN